MELLPDHRIKSHFLIKIDARVKIAAGLALLVMVLSYKGYLFSGIVAVLSLVVCLMMGIRVKLFLLRFSEPLFIIFMVVLLKFLFSGTEELFSITLLGIPVAGYRDGLFNGLLIAVRIAASTSLVALLGFATPFTEFMAALSWFKVPRLLIEVMMLAYRYIFLLLEEAMVIYNAQKNRLGYISIRRSLISFGTLAGSLIIRVYDQSRNTTTAMVQRGYDGHIPLAKHKRFKRSDLVVLFLFLVSMTVMRIKL